MAPLCLLAALALFSACANRVAPQGGPDDNTPPGIDSLHTTPGYQTNFTPRQIVFTFDEWVKLDDVFNQVVVSPPLNTPPEITLRGKTVRFAFDKSEVLKPDVTYTIQFGNAIKDLTEGNPVRDLRFVFSTGAFIDSLQIRGVVRDAYTDEPVENVLLMLYDNLSDTAVRTQRPFYFGKTNKEGLVSISNIKSGTFQVLALVDGNLNYLYDAENEKVGFPGNRITLPDSALNLLSIRLFESERKLRLIDQYTGEYGHVMLVFSRRPEETIVQLFDIDAPVWQENAGDTIHIWHDSATPWTAIVEIPGNGQGESVRRDTVYVKSLDKQAFIGKSALLPATKSGQSGRSKFAAASGAQVQHPLQPAALSFNHPLQSLDTALIRLLEDTTLTPVDAVFAIDSLQKRTLLIRYPWKDGVTYRLELLPGALTDLFGLRNDSVIQPYAVQRLKTYGHLRIKVSGLDSSRQYLFQLVNNDRTEAERMVSGVSTYETLVTTLPPGSYALRIVEDDNRNGRWDTGNYELGRQPERVMLHKYKELLRPDWELEVEAVWRR